jgi:hypothetical protein
LRSVPQDARDGTGFGTVCATTTGGTGHRTRRISMLSTIFVLLIVMWVLGMVTSYTLGGFIHILLLLAVASVLIRIIQGRPV